MTLLPLFRSITPAARFWLLYFASLMALVVWCLHAFIGGVLL